jgi:hypothetical protein
MAAGFSAPVGAQNSPQANAVRPVSAAEAKGIFDTLKSCWNVPSDPDKLPPIEIRIFLDSQGLITGTELVDKDYSKKSPQHNAAAQSALRSVANPHCRQLPASLGDIGQMIIVFDPKDPL